MATMHELDDIFGYMPFDHFLVVSRTEPQGPGYSIIADVIQRTVGTLNHL
jgi:hypothetical protein